MTFTVEKLQEVWKYSRERLDYLYARWRDEHDYEDFEDYVAAFKKHVEGLQRPLNCKLEVVRGTKRPFGFYVRVEDVLFFFYANAAKIGYKVVEQ